MTDIKKRLGEPYAASVSFTDACGVAQSLAGCVLRFEVFRSESDAVRGRSPLLLVSTYPDDGKLLIVDAANGSAFLQIRTGLDAQLDLRSYYWRLTRTAPLSPTNVVKASPASGTVTVAATGVLTFSDSSVAPAALPGWLVDVQGAGANDALVVVTAIPTADNELAANQLQTDYLGFTAAAGVSFELVESSHQVFDGLDGAYDLRV